MRAVQVLQTTGPADVRVVDVPEPEPGPGEVLVDVHAVGVSFPDLLLSQGLYQLRPEPPFTLGVDVAGTVVSTGSTDGGGGSTDGGGGSTDVAGGSTDVGGGSTDGGGGSTDGGGGSTGGVEVGARVVGVVPYGGAAERVVMPASWVLPLPDGTTYEVGAALPMNYLTALFALEERAGLRPGETVLVHGAAGGVGTAALQVAAGLGARTIAVVSTEEKARFAAAAGAHETVLVDGFKERVLELTEGRGVQVVVDVVGGDSFTDSLRCLAPLGRLLVVGFTSGQGIPEVKVNRLLLNNIDVRGVGWGGYAMATPGYLRAQWDRLLPMLEAGVVAPPIGATYALEEYGHALQELAQRRTLGKSVARVQ